MIPHAYPSEIARLAHERWRQLERLPDPGPCTLRRGTLPQPGPLEELLSIAYQASLLVEEDRPVRFRLFVGAPSRLPASAGPPDGLHALRFDEPRPYSEHEIRRLAPAAKYHRSLIGVRETARGSFEIWGVLQSGPRWLESARSGGAVASPVPNDALVVRAVGPGRVALALGDVTLVQLRGGRIEGAPMDAFDAHWLSSRFARLREDLMAEHDRAVEGLPAKPLEPGVTRKASQQVFRRTIATIREAHHGGTILVVPHERAASLLGDGGTLRLKYAFVDDEPRRRHRTLLLAVMRELALGGGARAEAIVAGGRAETLGGAGRGTPRSSLAGLDEAMLEMSHLLASLAEVDGAVLLNDRLELLGFGSEIVGPLPELSIVRRALDLEATEHELVRIDGVGTRHRSAYRLCAFARDAMAIVISQDGGVQFVAWHGGALTYWDHVPAAGADL